MDYAISAAATDGVVLARCGRLLSLLSRVHPPLLVTMAVSREGKRLFVQRLEACDGPLACHAIQECIHRHVCLCAAVSSRGDATQNGELEEWLRSVLDTIMDCLDRQVRSKQTAAKGLRCAIFLLQLLSTVLKRERDASHPERANHASQSEVDILRSDSTKAATALASNIDCEWDRGAAYACAKISNAYLGKMVQAATALKARERSCGPDSDHTTRSLGGEDIGFWVFTLVSDVLKCLRKEKVGSTDSASTKRRKINRASNKSGEPAVMSLSLPSDVELIGTAGIPHDDDDRACSGQLFDVPALAGLMAAFPVGRGRGLTDVALKWLEVTQALMEAAEAKCQGVLAGMHRLVPPVLWRMAGKADSLLLHQEVLRSPGSAFVETGGADGSLSQAMLTLVFRIILCEQKPGFADFGFRESIEENTSEQGTGGTAQERTPRTMRPWNTAAEALMATAAAIADDDMEPCLGFAGRLVRLFSDQDDALVDMLLTNLHIFNYIRPAGGKPGDVGERSTRSQPGLTLLYNGVLHPGALFAALLSEVRFDSAVLLDWLISPETEFLKYLTILLRLAVAEWPEFVVRVSCMRVDEFQNKVRSREQNREAVEREEEEELVLTEGEAHRLSMVVSCLNGLFVSARSLEQNSLAPFNLEPLLRRIEQVVLLYEECGDAEEGRKGCRISD